MYGDLTALSLMASIIVGMIMGMLMGFKWEVPNRWYTFLICFIFNILAPAIGSTTYLLGVKASSDLNGLVVSPLLFSFFFVLNVLYLYRRLKDFLPQLEDA